MKKILAGALIAALALSVAACGSSGSSSDGGNTETVQENTVNQGAAEEQEEVEEETPYAAGSWSDNVYTNESLGLTLPLPEGWVCGTSEELAESMGAGQEVTGATDEELSATDPIYDLYIYNEQTGASMMIMAEDLSSYGEVTPEEYLQSVTDQLQGYEDQGISYTIGDMSTTMVGNTEFVSVVTEGNYDGVTMYQEYDSAMVGGRLVTMIFTCPGENGTEVRESVYSTITGI